MTPSWLVLVLALALGGVQGYVGLAVLHLLYPLPAALWARRREAPLPVPAREGARPRVAVLIAAHDEEAVLPGALEALARQRYPREAYDVHVVADRCADRTAELARRTGATVLERQGAGPSTKGQALAALWASLPAGAYDVVVVLDADNHAAPDCLAALVAELAGGYAAVQGLRRAKAGPGETAVAGLDGLTELCTHRVGAAGRRALGLNGPLMGSGVAYRADWFDALIREVGTTVVEDCEWQARLALRGARIGWSARAIVEDEKTADARALDTQRARWMAGRGAVARAYAWPLLCASVGRGGLSALDMAVFLLSPPRVLSVGAMGLLALAGLVAPGWPGLWPAGLWLAGLAGFALYVLAGLWLDGAPPRAYLALAGQALTLPRFAWAMARATFLALRGASVAWVPTRHGRANGASPPPSVPPA